MRSAGALVLGLLALVAACGGKSAEVDEKPLPVMPLPAPIDEEPPPRVTEPAPPASPEVAGVTEESEAVRLPAAKALFYGILEQHCGECHGRTSGADASEAPGPLEFTYDIERMKAVGVLVPFNGVASEIVNTMLDGSMPPAEVEPRPTESEIETIRYFIDNPRNWPDEPPRYAD